MTDKNTGQINRHKTQQQGQRPVANYHPAHHRRTSNPACVALKPSNTHLENAYRHAHAPYPPRAHRVGRAPAAHQHRTLNLNATNGTASQSGSEGTTTPTGWVARNDRHRQLINASVYEKESQTRAKAIEETRKRKLDSRRNREKAQFTEFLKHQSGTSSAPTNPTASTGTNMITIEGIQFQVLDGGKKLVKLRGK